MTERKRACARGRSDGGGSLASCADAAFVISMHPRPRDRERPRRAIEVDEQHFTVRREAGSRQFRVDPAQRERKDLSRGCDPSQMVGDILGVLVLADHEVAARSDRQVVAEVELIDRGAFEEELQTIGGAYLRAEAEYLAQLGRSAAGAAEVEFA